MLDRIATVFLHLFFWVYSYFHMQSGKQNRLLLCSGGRGERRAAKLPPFGLKVCLRGSGNRIILHPGTKFSRSSIMCEGDNATVEIFEGCILNGLDIFVGGGDGSRISVGRYCTTEGVKVVARGRRELVIGDDCMFASGVLVRLSDSHPIRDAATGEIINGQAHPLVIGRHSWVGQDVRLTKNAVVAANTVIGLGSVVTGVFAEEGTCLGGNPARILRRNVAWSRALED